MHSGGDAGRVLVVCRANVCRSPFGHQFLVAQLRSRGVGGVFSVDSAGVDALPGMEMPAEMSRQLGRHGVPARPHQARSLTRYDLQAAALVLAASRSVRSDVARLFPAAHARLFTVRQAARLLDDVPAPGAGDVATPVVALARGLAAARGRRVPAGVDDDVVDPWRCPADVYARSADQLADAMTALAAALKRYASADGSSLNE